MRLVVNNYIYNTTHADWTFTCKEGPADSYSDSSKLIPSYNPLGIITNGAQNVSAYNYLYARINYANKIFCPARSGGVRFACKFNNYNYAEESISSYWRTWDALFVNLWQADSEGNIVTNPAPDSNAYALRMMLFASNLNASVVRRFLVGSTYVGQSTYLYPIYRWYDAGSYAYRSSSNLDNNFAGKAACGWNANIIPYGTGDWKVNVKISNGNDYDAQSDLNYPATVSIRSSLATNFYAQVGFESGIYRNYSTTGAISMNKRSVASVAISS